MRKIKVRNTKNNIFPPRIGLPKRTGQEDKEDKRRIGTHLKTKGKKTPSTVREQYMKVMP